MPSIDFASAKMKHLTWKFKLRGFLDGKEKLTETLLSEHDCDLGKWLYSEGMSKYGTIPETQKLENTHRADEGRRQRQRRQR